MSKVIVIGSNGRMGRKLIELIHNHQSLELIAGIDIGDDITQHLDKADVVIDFSTPNSTCYHITLLAKHRRPAVIGTTGLTDKQKQSIYTASQNIPIVFSPNMSLGINLLWKLIKASAKLLPQVKFLTLKEAHHKHKKDKPSGTAKHILSIISSSDSWCNKPIDIICTRKGETVGKHSLDIKLEFEKLTLSHEAFDRAAFAVGALEAAQWVIGKKPGVYSMEDVLNLKEAI